MNPTFYWLVVALTTIISAARLTRLATVDKFPPARWLRDKYADATDGSEWQWLVMCGYCFAPWSALLIVAWGYFAGVYQPYTLLDGEWSGARDVWWLFNGWFAASYLAAVFMAHDGDDGEDD